MHPHLGLLLGSTIAAVFWAGCDDSFSGRPICSSPGARSGCAAVEGSVGDTYDNAMCESFFATLGRELLERERFRNQAEAKMRVFDFIEGWHNPHRRHSALANESPITSERKHAPQRKHAA